eukprot:CAMPEP_0202690396 /NCGR_PEP_ID=MMETSP1385-20130828/5391_1 /ASSEMBLY_ACC=CAM_ASM_000861 /TAXON_ID=933848 /ORGANISM="Elphidium margaritaceum" /LENGTH=779 /DNA_ID=CAMNT_0049345657 /DNA_START=26 /DNA_END=2365 /DNA_ORIENTATION=-
MSASHFWLSTLTYLMHVRSILSECDTDCDYCLVNEDFETGTYRILNSAKYCLGEDIVFNPRAPDEDLSYASPNGHYYNWFPGEYRTDLEQYPGTLEYINKNQPVNGPFAGGFFAAITVETVDVEIDLQGHSIAQHPHFNTQQRFYANIEVQNKPYDELSKRTTGIWMWGPSPVVNNIYIHNGILGLSSHHGIHSNGATNVVIEDMQIHSFEVGGVQFNDFDNVTLRNIDIGPSNANVRLNGYYGNARFDLLTLKYLNASKPEHDIIQFADGRNKTLFEIEADLIAAMDIAFRFANDLLTDEDVASPLYATAIQLFSNEANQFLPDGSTLYGVLFNSFLDAVQGFGQQNQYGNNEDVDIQGLVLDNVHIHDLKKAVNEVPVVYMNPCYDDPEVYGSWLYSRENLYDVVRTPLGSVLDLRLMIDDGFHVIDEGVVAQDASMYSEYLRYSGNVLTDAQIGIKLFDVFKSRITTIMEDWATLNTGNDVQSLPECMQFMCNSDIIFQTNKGIIGVRLDEIDAVEIRDVSVSNLYNLSPLASNACGRYSGPTDGGNLWQIDGAGNMNGQIRGISIYGSQVNFDGQIEIRNLVSSYGDVYGVHVMKDSLVTFENDDTLTMTITDLYPENQLDEQQLNTLIALDRTPFPNNFHGQCNILVDEVVSSRDFITVDPPIPNGVDTIECAAPVHLPQITPLAMSITQMHHSDFGETSKKHSHSHPNYIRLLCIILSVLFLFALGAYISCIAWNHGSTAPKTFVISSSDSDDDEVLMLKQHIHSKYGAVCDS